MVIMLAGCANGPTGSSDGPDDPAASRQRIRPSASGVDRVLSVLPQLREAPPLPRSDQLLLQQGLPLPLPLVLRNTQAVTGKRQRTRTWLAPGTFGEQRSPAACLYFKFPRQENLGAGCFDLRTVRRQRAVQVLAAEGGTDVVGILTSEAKRVVVSGSGGRRVDASVRVGSYSARTAFQPTKVAIVLAKKTITVELAPG